jgi:hypothetical protein
LEISHYGRKYSTLYRSHLILTELENSTITHYILHAGDETDSDECGQRQNGDNMMVRSSRKSNMEASWALMAAQGPASAMVFEGFEDLIAARKGDSEEKGGDCV